MCSVALGLPQTRAASHIQQPFLELEKLKFELMKQQYEDQKHKEVCKTMAITDDLT